MTFVINRSLGINMIQKQNFDLFVIFIMPHEMIIKLIVSI